MCLVTSNRYLKNSDFLTIIYFSLNTQSLGLESAFSSNFAFASLECCSYPYAYKVALGALTMTSAFHVTKKKADEKQQAVSVQAHLLLQITFGD